MVEKSVQFLLHIPGSLLDEIRALAAAEQRSVSGQIVYLLRQALAARK